MTRPAPAPATPLREWLAFQHIDRACDLVDPKVRVDNGHGVVDTWRIEMAKTHLAIAQAKMTGGGRRA